jgi:hypothetical protein
MGKDKEREEKEGERRGGERQLVREKRWGGERQRGEGRDNLMRMRTVR